MEKRAGMRFGILAVQGDFDAHAAALTRMGVEYVFVRTPRNLEGVDAVILPGGESTTQWKLLVEEGLDKSLAAHAAKGGAIFGTCAGAILRVKCAKVPPPSLQSRSKWCLFVRPLSSELAPTWKCSRRTKASRSLC